MSSRLEFAWGQSCVSLGLAVVRNPEVAREIVMVEDWDLDSLKNAVKAIQAYIRAKEYHDAT